jgi:uncharacterized protein
VDDTDLTLANLVLAPFAARAPWWGGDLQTIRNYIGRRVALASHAVERLVLPMTDGTGDRIAAVLNHPAAPRPGGPLVVLIHGLSGGEASVYMLRCAGALLARGFPVLRLNLRGAAEGRSLARFQYHAGRTGDLEMALAALPQKLTANGVAAVGYSLGGNMLLKYLGERGHAHPLRAAVSVSAPIDLAATSHRMQHWRNYAYQAKLMRDMRFEALTPSSELSATERAAVARARSIAEFDAGFSAPRNGFSGLEDYYEQNSAQRYLDGIKVPTLVIHALDDPWVPAAPYLAYDWKKNRSLVAAFPAGGGHVGFHGSDRRNCWHDLATVQFLESVFSRS